MSIHQLLDQLKLHAIAAELPNAEKLAMEQSWPLRQFLSHLLQTELNLRLARATERRIRYAKFPVRKTIDQFDWSWPSSIKRPAILSLCSLDFIRQKHNVIFIGPTGVGKSHLASALGFLACQNGFSTRFVSTMDLINHLCAAAASDQLRPALRIYSKPHLLILDELGYIPTTKSGADLLFQLLSSRYERSSTIITTNKTYKDWPEIFSNDAALVSALLDRLLHRASTFLINAKSYRMKDASHNH